MLSKHLVLAIIRLLLAVIHLLLEVIEMGWHGPTGDCSCCDEESSSSSISSSSNPSSSSSESSSSSLSSSSSSSSSSVIDPCDCDNLPATLLLKIEIEDFAPLVYARFSTPQCQPNLEWSTLDDINGTYLFPLERNCNTWPPTFTLPPTQAIKYSTRRVYNFNGSINKEDPWLRVNWTRLADLSGGFVSIQSFSSDPSTASTSERDLVIGAGVVTPTCDNYSVLKSEVNASTQYTTQSPCVQVTGPIPGKVTVSLIAGEAP